MTLHNASALTLFRGPGEIRALARDLTVLNKPFTLSQLATVIINVASRKQTIKLN